METWRVIKDNGPINTVISANKIFTGQHWVGIFDITEENEHFSITTFQLNEGKLSAQNVLVILSPPSPPALPDWY